MKILVMSDSHGNLKGVEKALKKLGSNADVVVHCGDGTRGEALWLKENCGDKKVVCVRGNCDFTGDMKDEEYFEVCGKKIMATHGHLYGVKYGLVQGGGGGRVAGVLRTHPYPDRREDRRGASDQPGQPRTMGAVLRGC